ncbi:MAG: TlpA family protein disulfide reductase [Deltaproteobacteria bacterium]|nr:TlpA family protein disulfide reductase [Deltaproteobacteria bacterium]
MADDALSYKFKRVNGGYSTLHEFSSEIIVLYFFSSYCVICLFDIEFIRQNEEYFSKNKIAIIGIGMDYNKETTLLPFIEINKIKFPVMIADENITNGDWVFGKITTIPASILINKKEKRYKIYTGNLTRDIILQIR